MRRSDRLFQLIQILRRARRPVIARSLAEELEVSTRTVYRDIADLMAQRVPIRGEAGTGYVLDRQYDMPPLMLTAEELEAAVLGAQWVAQRSDAVLSRAANDLIAKIAAAVPDHLRPFIADPTIGAVAPLTASADTLDMSQLREWIRNGRKLRIRYRDEAERMSERTIWPILIGYADAARLLAAWCELRQAFRHFRTDRIVSIHFLDERHGERRLLLVARWKRYMKESRGVDLSG
ncbi:YafY family protein [Caballeronia sp. LZ065]|uniref:helix-turn-helix transcriptional regulator n=1 Tax=Caballeronia sp. LZ065 TaxID=3038571 RepID=UPI00285984AB|nr:YafY family protein [Caballeronia sp. LZ065]MDR5781384.1 YafY family protein [Caballeronia sp. LZ065]